jgi:hypothetical protein
MTLPELSWQIIYGRLAWAIVAVTLVSALWPARLQLSRGTLGALLLGGLLLAVLPGSASLAYWLGLAIQWPSGLLAGLCMVKLVLAWQGKRDVQVMTVPLALPLAAAGTVLYLDAMGLISLGLYYRGFGPLNAPLTGLVIAAACALAAMRGVARPQALAALIAIVLFAVPRLPSGNLWDALLDPLLWGWALFALARHGWRRVWARPTVPLDGALVNR